MIWGTFGNVGNSAWPSSTIALIETKLRPNKCGVQNMSMSPPPLTLPAREIQCSRGDQSLDYGHSLHNRSQRSIPRDDDLRKIQQSAHFVLFFPHPLFGIVKKGTSLVTTTPQSAEAAVIQAATAATTDLPQDAYTSIGVSTLHVCSSMFSIVFRKRYRPAYKLYVFTSCEPNTFVVQALPEVRSSYLILLVEPRPRPRSSYLLVLVPQTRFAR